MNINRTSLLPAAWLMGTAVALVCAVPGPLRAQGRRTLPNQTDTISGRDLGSRERQLRKIESDNTKARDPKEILVEVNEDLGRLRTLNESISVYMTAPTASPNYNFIVDSSMEVKKRSSRLRSSLALPREENNDGRPSFKDAEKGELHPALAALNKLLHSFLHNPIFSDAGEIDMQLAAKAGRDLDDIIVLSEKLRKNAEKRGKSAGKTP